MGKTKTKIMDGSIQEESKPKKKLGRTDELVEKLKAELGVEEKNLPSNTQPQKLTSKIQHPTSKSKPRSKKYQEAVKDLDRNKAYSLNEAVEMVKKLSYSKFNGALEAHINTIQTGLRGLVSLPYASGPAGMPKGLMPNPKSGTIVIDLKKGVESFEAGKTEYKQSLKTPATAVVFKTESKAPVIHLGLGKLNQPTEELSANIKTLLQILGKSRIKKVSLSPTMGPSVKLDLNSI